MALESFKIITGLYKGLSNLIKFALICMEVVLHHFQPNFFWFHEHKFFMQILTDAVVPYMYINHILSVKVLKLFFIGGPYFSDPNLRLTHVPGLICNHMVEFYSHSLSLTSFLYGRKWRKSSLVLLGTLENNYWMLTIVRYVCNIISKKFIMTLFSLKLRDVVVSHHVLDKAFPSFAFQYHFPHTEILVFRRILQSLDYDIQQRLPCCTWDWNSMCHCFQPVFQSLTWSSGVTMLSER